MKPYTTVFGTVLILMSSTVAAAAALSAANKPNIFLIRHAEKNKDGAISAQGEKRALCLVDLFGVSSGYDIEKIIVQNPYPGDYRSQRPYNTTLPLAESLGITIEHQCDWDEPACAAAEAKAYRGPGNILMAWEHTKLPQVCEHLGAAEVPAYNKTHFDYIYNQPYPYTMVEVTTQNCPGIDD